MPGPEEHCSALELDPNDIMAQFFYARLLDGSGDKASAHKYYQQVLRRLPQDAEAHYYYGRSLGEAFGRLPASRLQRSVTERQGKIGKLKNNRPARLPERP